MQDRVTLEGGASGGESVHFVFDREVVLWHWTSAPRRWGGGPDADVMFRLHTIQADTTDPTPRRPAADAARRAWERLWSNECLDARARAMADRTGAGAR